MLMCQEKIHDDSFRFFWPVVVGKIFALTRGGPPVLCTVQ